ncbi:MAG: hypothetical protein HC822_26955 [Oscillochloris sp.]|nr:hypothetical protein [Oscillochloris sp.]
MSLDERFFRRKVFSELISELAAAFYRRREQRAAADSPLPPVIYPFSPWDTRCVSSAIRPAMYRGTIGEEDLGTLTLSATAARRRFVGQVVKRSSNQRWYEDAFGWSLPAALGETRWSDWAAELVSWEQYWIDWLADEGAQTPYAQSMARLGGAKSVVSPRDVHEIGAASDRYIALIYADGNRVGAWMETCRSPEDFRARSQALDAVTKQAVFQALSAHLEPQRVRRISGRAFIHPFEILTIGGDDILMIVPAAQALAITHAIAHAFERSRDLVVAGAQPTSAQPRPDRYRGSGDEPVDPPTAPVFLSAGVVIAREDTPIFFLRDLVEELLKNAKGHARRRQESGSVGGAVDVLALKSISMVTNNIKEYRRLALGQEQKAPDSATRRLTARPYTWHELNGLIQTIKALKQASVPRSQLYRLREVLEETAGSGVIAGSLEYLYTRSRMRREHNTALLNAVELAWQSEASGVARGSSAPPWLRRTWPGIVDAGWETIWPDLVELYDFVAVAPQEDR